MIHTGVLLASLYQIVNTVSQRARISDTQPLRLVIYVDEGAHDPLLAWIRGVLVPERSDVLVDVEPVCRGMDVRYYEDATAAIVIAASAVQSLHVLIHQLNQRQTKTLILAAAHNIAYTVCPRPTPRIAAHVVFTFDELEEILKRWLVRFLHTDQALPGAFAISRDVVVRRRIEHCAYRNVAVALMGFLPLSESSLMVHNEFSMLGYVGDLVNTDYSLRLPLIVATGLSAMLLRGAAQWISMNTPVVTPVVHCFIAFGASYALGWMLYEIQKGNIHEDYAVDRLLAR